jgi:hypothetical protein
MNRRLAVGGAGSPRLVGKPGKCHAIAKRWNMEKRTLKQLEAALEAVGHDLSPRVAELAEKSTNGLLTPEESQEYAEIVRLNDMLSLLKLQAEAFWTIRAAS